MTGPEMMALRDALRAAFDLPALDRMLMFRLSKDRQTIVATADLNSVLFDLIKVALREGWLKNLVRAAVEENPGNADLREFASRYGYLDSQVPKPEIAPSEERRRAPSPARQSALSLWQEKLEYLRREEAIAANPAQRFELMHQIEEALAKIRELGG